MARRFADVLLPLAAPMYTFSIPDALSERIGEGCLVAVPLGARKIYTGVVWRMHSTPPQHETVKPILGILYPERAVSASQMKFWEWMAEYYMCRTGEVMRSALPKSSRPTCSLRASSVSSHSGQRCATSKISTRYWPR